MRYSWTSRLKPGVSACAHIFLMPGTRAAPTTPTTSLPSAPDAASHTRLHARVPNFICNRPHGNCHSAIRVSSSSRDVALLS